VTEDNSIVPQTERKGTGKWAQPGVPHRGWECTNIEDNEEQSFLCEMCEVMLVRYIHTMEHHDYHEVLRVGCICAGNMEQDLVGARRREAEFKKRQARRRNWLKRQWRTSMKGNSFVNTDGYNVVVYRKGTGWAARVKQCESGRQVMSRQPYETAEAAKLAAFDAMLDMKEHCPVETRQTSDMSDVYEDYDMSDVCEGYVPYDGD
jgi:hypothetical protein